MNDMNDLPPTLNLHVGQTPVEFRLLSGAQPGTGGASRCYAYEGYRLGVFPHGARRGYRAFYQGGQDPSGFKFNSTFCHDPQEALNKVWRQVGEASVYRVTVERVFCDGERRGVRQYDLEPEDFHLEKTLVLRGPKSVTIRGQQRPEPSAGGRVTVLRDPKSA